MDGYRVVINGRPFTLGDDFQIGDFESTLHALDDRSVELRAKALRGHGILKDPETTVTLVLPRP